MNELFQTLYARLREIWSLIGISPQFDLVPFLETVPPYNGPLFGNPVTGLAIVVTLAVSSGIVLTAFGVFLLASLVVYLILTAFLGISIDMPAMRG